MGFNASNGQCCTTEEEDMVINACEEVENDLACEQQSLLWRMADVARIDMKFSEQQ